MVFCIHCGTQLNDDDCYCNKCGKVKTRSPSRSQGLLNKLRTSTNNAIKKGLEVGVQTSEELVDLSKKGVNKVKEAVDPEDDPLKIIHVRYAKGEISRDEYEEMKKALLVTH